MASLRKVKMNKRRARDAKMNRKRTIKVAAKLRKLRKDPKVLVFA